jgi:hypothetical protein
MDLRRPVPSYLAGVNRNSCNSSVGMAKEEVTTATADDFKTQLFKNADEFLAFEARKAGHTEIC